MRPLSPDAGSLVAEARNADIPTRGDRERIKRSILLRVGAVAATSTGGVAASVGAAATSGGAAAITVGEGASVGVPTAVGAGAAAATSGAVGGAAAAWIVKKVVLVALAATLVGTGAVSAVRWASQHSTAPTAGPSPGPSPSTKGRVTTTPVDHEGPWIANGTAADPASRELGAVASPSADSRGAETSDDEGHGRESIKPSMRTPIASQASIRSAPPSSKGSERREAVGDPVAAETEILRRSREELRAGRPEQALRTLVEYDRRFARGVLGEERRAIGAMAQCQARPGSWSKGQAEAFLRSAPTSPLAERVRAACGLTSGLR